MKNKKIALISALSVLLCSCSGFFDKDNTPPPSPLVKFTQETRIRSLWSTSTGSGVGSEYLKLVPAVTSQAVFTANRNGYVTATNRCNGKTLWQTNTGVAISGGPAADGGLVFVGSRNGDVVALEQCSGKIVWRAKVSSEILASPSAENGIVLIKSIDGKLTAFSAQSGANLWVYEESEPLLILRGASAPQIKGNNVVAGFANGSLAHLTLRDGSLIWHQAIATPEGSFAIQRMIDVDADPIIYGSRVYAATYQGKVSSRDLSSGREYWTHDISSYTGIAADGCKVYVSDAKGHLWAFDANTGSVFWRQNQLEFRNISGPALIGNLIVVGDEEGYLHFMNKQDGHFVARVRVDNSGILAAPVVDNNILYVVTKNGQLAAYSLG